MAKKRGGVPAALTTHLPTTHLLATQAVVTTGAFGATGLLVVA